MDILRRLYKAGNMRENAGVCHCCSASPEIAKELVKMGFYIGFDGPITFKNNKNTPAVCEAIPMDRIVIETDSPYLAPVPVRGRRNDSGNLPYICAKIAEVKGMAEEEIASLTLENGRKLFQIGT